LISHRFFLRGRSSLPASSTNRVFAFLRQRCTSRPEFGSVFRPQSPARPPAKLFLLVAAVALIAPLRAASPTEEIEALLTYVKQLDGASFVRNGEAYAPAAAEKHLRLKWEKAKDSVKTAEQFIADCASKSSMTGQPYEVRLKTGTVVRAEDLLRAELKRLRESASSQAPPPPAK
jgi:hypothetical protein